MPPQPLIQPQNFVPKEILCARDYELLAKRFISPPLYAYIAGGSGKDVTAANNVKAFDSHALLPRVCKDVSSGHTRTQLLNHDYTHPVLLAPVAYQKLVHPQGEVETARAANATDTCLVTSSLSSTRLEDITAHAGAQRWFQLYFQNDRKTTLRLLRKAEAAGYQSIVVTLDASIQLPSQSAQRSGFQMPADMQAVNLEQQEPAAYQAIQPRDNRIFREYALRAPSFDDLHWLLEQTNLPVLAKGVLHADDAVALKQIGIAGIIVSNHGGRTLDGAPSSLRMLPCIRAATGDSFMLLLDSGIRSGTDIFKALALGADAVLIGRLQMYALAVAGAIGVAHMLTLLREELELCMALCGCNSIQDISPSNLTTFQFNKESLLC